MKSIFATAAMSATLVFASTVQAETIKVPEGTEFPIRLEETISSKTAAEGDRFTISLGDDVKLPDGTVLHAGYRGVGEIVHLKKSGAMGKSAELNIKLNYLRVGDERIRLRASKGKEGGGNTGNMVIAIAFVGVFGLLVKGHSAEIPKGQTVTAFAESDQELTTPLAKPPGDA